MKKLAVLASGAGSILQALIAHDLPIALVVADRPCPALDIADAAGIPTWLIRRPSFGPDFNRTAYTTLVITALHEHHINLIAMAGWMTILDPAIFDAFPRHILNTHPSLLPAFKGDRAVADALAYGVKLTGCTVHIATAELDAGPILAQAAVPVLPSDTRETLHERIKHQERKLYPHIIRQLMQPESGQQE